MKTKLRILIADDHKMIREALRHLIEAVPEHEVIALAGDGDEVLRLAHETSPDIVCMDIDMPGMNGVEITRRLMAASPGVKVVALSSFSDQHYVLDMLSAGARAYVTKAEASEELLRAIQAVRRDRVYLCPDVAEAVTANLTNRGDERAFLNQLAPREREVLQLVAKGCTSVQIAQRLHIAPSTADAHRRNIMRKLDLRGIAELTRYAIRNGIATI